MKTRKLIVGILVFIASVLSFAFLSTSNAYNAETMYVKIKRQREATVEWAATSGGTTAEHNYKANYSYQLDRGDKNTKNVWNLYTTTGVDGTADTGAASNLYCLRAGLGFVDNNNAPDSDLSPAVKYTQAFDMVKDYKKIQDMFAKFNNTEVDIFNSDNIKNFNSVMWILDNMLLEDATQEEIDNFFITNKIYGSREELKKDYALYKGNVLNKADIEAIQQLAIWYFTNEKDNKGNTDTMYHPADGKLKTLLVKIENVVGTGGAKANLETTDYETMIQAYTFQFNLDGTLSPTDCGNPRFTAAQKLFEYFIDNATAEANKLGNTLYEPVSTEIIVHTTGENDAAVQQPIVEVKKKKAEVDVVLRKFISKVESNGKVTTYNRAPEVDTSKLNQNGVTTATYYHKKDAVPVKVGDVVTYTLRLYNEGNIKATINNVTDYLPAYLDYVGGGDDAGAWWRKTDTLGRIVVTNECVVTDVGGNTERKWINHKLSQVVIPEAEYRPNTKDYKLSYVDIQISCKVMPTAPLDENITNIAQITAQTFANGGTDRDSTPNSFLTLPADTELPNYTGGKKQKNNTTEKVDPCYDGTNAIKDPKDPNKEYYPGQEDDDDFEKIIIYSPKVDLALRKYITKVESNGVEKEYDRAPKVDTAGLKAGDDTAKYYHSKDPVDVKIGDVVTYTLRIYNEGEVNGRVGTITDHLAKNLELATLDISKPWIEVKGDKYNTVTSTATCKVVGASPNMINPDPTWDGGTPVGRPLGEVVIPAYDKENDVLSYVDVEIKCLVLPVETTTKITNIAEITTELKEDGTPIDKDRDSEPGENLKLPEPDKLPDYTGGKNDKNDPYYDGSNAEVNPKDPNDKYYPGQEDDDDFEKLVVVVPELDLALRKYISAVDGTPVTGENSREPVVDTSKLNNHSETTANYVHPKNPIMVNKGSLVTYTIRVYNEGEINGYVSEITDYLPNYLDYLPNNEINKKYRWEYDEATRQVTTEITAKDTIYLEGNTDDVYEGRENGKMLLKYNGTAMTSANYIDVQIVCKVNEKALGNGILTNLAQITGETKEDGTPVIKDKDSEPDKNLSIPEDGKRPNYTGGKNNKNDPYYDGSNAINGYYPGQEDDDDFEKVQVKPDFDLALRKFITGVDNSPVNDRYPEVIYKDGKITYNHKKTPVDVATGEIVYYTIRIFNEGEADGYANEVTDDLPEGLEFLPDNEVNKQYRWKMLDENQEETTNVKEAKYIITDYLSEDQQKATGRNNLIKAFNKSANISEQNPDYRDVKLAFKVTYMPKTKEETRRLLVNVAQISKDSGDDIDSKPNRDEKYDPSGNNEDDIDFDNVRVKYFDLSLLKWVSQTQVTLNGKTTTTNTGHTAATAKNENPVKIEVEAKNIKKIVIKYVYQIQITNEGEIEGAATEIKDYIPAGLKFEAKDNKDWGWKVNKEGVVTTDYLKGKILKPGESATVPIVLTWINSADNLGEKVNLAEISKHYNKPGVPDIDSTPDNKKPGEDDIDDAPVIIATKTGSAQLYLGLVGIITITLASGISLIKKYVL